MKKIYGFFASHGFWWWRKFPLIMDDIRTKFLDNGGVKIVLLENIGFDPLWAKEIFDRSIKESDFVKLWTEGYLKRYGSKDEYLSFKKHYSLVIKENLLNSPLNNGQRRLSLYNELSKLRQTVNFRLLMESGTTNQINQLRAIYGQCLYGGVNAFIAGNYAKYKHSMINAASLLIEIGDMRDCLVQSSINKLSAKHKDISFYVVFGNLHSPMLRPFEKKQDHEVSLIVDYASGEDVLFRVYDKIRAGKEISDNEIDSYLVYFGVAFLCEWINQKSKDLELNPGRVMDILIDNFSVDWFNDFLCLDFFGERVGAKAEEKTLYFLHKLGVFDILESEFPDEIKFCKTLLN